MPGMELDIFDRLDKVSKGAFSVFRDLKYNRDVETNMTRIEEDDMTRTQKETLSRRLKELKDIDVIRKVSGPLIDTDGERIFRVQAGTHIINPELIRCLEHNTAEHYWEQCKGK